MPTISKNIFWSSLTSVLQLYTGSVVFIVLAKLMSVEDFGVLSFGFSLSTIAVIASDFGFSLMVMKDYPGKIDHKTYLSNSIVAKMFLAIGSTVLFLAYLLLFYQGKWLMVGLLYIFFSVIASFTIYFQALLRVRNEFNKYSKTSVVYAVAISFAILIYWYFQLGLLQLIWVFLGCKSIQLLWAIYCCKGAFPKFSYSFKGVSKLLKDSWSFGMFGVMGIMYVMIDTQIISIYLKAKDVALYQSVFRIVVILMVFSEIVSNVLLPYLSFKFYSKENVSELVSKIFLYLLIIGCSWFLLFTSFKVEILEILYSPEYAEAAILVVPFSIMVILRTVATLLGNILTISNRQTARVVTVGVSLLISVILNVILIPKFGISAAAWTSVLVHVILFGMYFIFSKMEVPKMKLLSSSSTLVLGASTIMYFIINQFDNDSVWIESCCALIWLLLIAFVMKRDNNLRFLQMILKEKGVG